MHDRHETCDEPVDESGYPMFQGLETLEQRRRRTVVRVNDTLIFPDGTSRPLTADERQRMDAGEEVLVDLRSGRSSFASSWGWGL